MMPLTKTIPCFIKYQLNVKVVNILRFTPPDAIHRTVVGVGGGVHRRVRHGVREHAAVERLLWQRVVGRVELARHQVNVDRRLEIHNSKQRKNE